MTHRKTLRDRLALLTGFRRAGEMDERFKSEMDFHVAMSTQKNVRSGMTTDEARRAASVEFGGRAQWREAARDETRSRYLEELLHDARYAIRSLRRAPAFTAAAVATLALSIGATTSIFSVVNAALLRRLPYANPDRVVAVCEWLTTKPISESCGAGSFSVANYVIWRSEAKSFDGFAAFIERRVSVTPPSGEPISAQARITSAGLFPVVGARPALGRFFTPTEDVQGGPNVVVLSYPFWKQTFGGDSSVIGKKVILNTLQYEVVGVGKQDLVVYEPVDLWLPARFSDAQRTQPGRSLRTIALLKPGVTVERASAEMKQLSARRAQDEPRYNSNMTAYVTPLKERLVGNSRAVLWTLLGAVGFLLLIACANVANLLLARASDREREVAVRISIGASPQRIVRQLLTESVVLSVVSALLGFGLAIKGTALLVALVPSDLGAQLPQDVTVDWRLLAFIAAVGVGTGVLFGVVPALQAARGDVQETLKEGGRGGSNQSRSSARLRSALVVAEMSLALVLLTGAGLMVRSFAALQRVDLGFRPEHALTARISLPGRKYPSDTAVAAFFKQAESRIAQQPGVRSVGSISYMPLTGERSVTGFDIEGRPAWKPGEGPGGDMRAVTPGYFAAMGIPIREGRGFTDTDDIGSEKVGIVSQTLAKSLFPNESPINHYLLYDWGTPQRVRIVGVAGDVHHDGAAKETYMEIYRPLPQFQYNSMAMVVRVEGDPSRIATPMRKAVRDIDANIPLASVMPMTELVTRSVGSTRLSATLFGLFGVLGLLLAGIGIYGVMTYTVQQRRHEIGVRLALGAGPRDVVAMVVGRAARLSAIGIVIGTVLAFAGSGLLKKLLFGVPAHDAMTFAGVAIILAVIGTIAAVIPGLRATHVDPVSALRGE
jgi:putative ABC transport system permease protein